MTPDWLQALGGLGLFLVGMRMLTGALSDLAGGGLRAFLRRSTAGPARGVLAGAGATALLQSSSAVTVAAVGFVAAGLIGFRDSLGLILGANIGTTVTGWLVALIGFKLDLGAALTPAVLVGALASLFAPGRGKAGGWALAGFGVLFLGIDAMQDGMAALRGLLSPEDFPPDTILGRLQLVALGAVVTVVTQSSSAGVAAALAALAAGAVSFPQAAALVIGMNVGTTASAILAALGGGATSRRTGLGHVLHNLGTAVLAFGLLGPLGALAVWGRQAGLFDPQLWLVGFHTAFNLLGVAVALAVLPAFARLLERLVPDDAPDLSRRLDPALKGAPGPALAAAAATARDLDAALREALADALGPRRPRGLHERLRRVEAAEADLRDWLAAVDPGEDAAAAARLRGLLHALDHLSRLRHRLMQDQRTETLRAAGDLAGDRDALAALAPDPPSAASAEAADALRRRLRRRRDDYRAAAVERAAAGRLPAEELGRRMDAVRWLHRSAYHLWRIRRHLADVAEDAPPRREETEAALAAGED